MTSAAPAASWNPDDLMAHLKKDQDGLVAAVIQQHDTGEVLMLGWMDEEALRRTLSTGRVTFWSRSRQEYWRKGDTSGHVQYVRAAAVDCDGDALLVQVEQVGAACHEGTRTCFQARPVPVVQGGPGHAEAGSAASEAAQTSTAPSAGEEQAA